MNVSRIAGPSYEAVFHYQLKDTVYDGTASKSLEVRIVRATTGKSVLIDVKVGKDGEIFIAKTSFTLQ